MTNKSFSMNNQKMVYDRGRYKTANNVGSVSEDKAAISKRDADYYKYNKEKQMREMEARRRVAGGALPVPVKPPVMPPRYSRRPLPIKGRVKRYYSRGAV